MITAYMLGSSIEIEEWKTYRWVSIVDKQKDTNAFFFCTAAATTEAPTIDWLALCKFIPNDVSCPWVLSISKFPESKRRQLKR